jgi:hypothetical protein
MQRSTAQKMKEAKPGFPDFASFDMNLFVAEGGSNAGQYSEPLYSSTFFEEC